MRTPARTAADAMRSNAEIFMDGCHKYGWIITLFGNLLVGAYLIGTQAQKFDDMKAILVLGQEHLEQRATRLEQQMDRLLGVPQ